MNGGTAIVPDLDSVDQFRVLTNNFDPQYGNYNGGIVNVVTKSGSDAFRGNALRFLPQHDARREATTSRRSAPSSSSNQPGGTVGGPLKKGKVFFFADYQGTRTTQGIETGIIPVPSLAEPRRQLLGRRRAPSTAPSTDRTGRACCRSGSATRCRPASRTTRRVARATAQCVLPNAIIPHAGLVVARRRSCCSTCPTPNVGGNSAFRPARSRRPCATTRGPSASTATAGCWACCPATTSSTTIGWTTLSRRAGRRERARASTR